MPAADIGNDIGNGRRKARRWPQATAQRRAAA